MDHRFEIIRRIVGELDTNCYILSDGARCLIIDPGADGESVVRAVEDGKLEPVAVVLTHGHYDHIGAAESVASHFEILIYAHPAEFEVLSDPEKNFSIFALGRPITVEGAEAVDEGPLPFEGFEAVKVVHLPGHTPGGIGLVGDDFFISGDTVFGGGGVGRTDLPGGDPRKLADSIRKILSFDDSLVLYPGHGGRSVLKREKPLWRQVIRMLEDGLL